MNTNNEKIRKRVEQMLTERDEALRPIWVRAPKPGAHDFFSGLGRGKLFQAAALGYVRTASLKPPGAARGVRLFDLRSILKYVESCVTLEPTAAQEPATTTTD
jgi:hypothetical protein